MKICSICKRKLSLKKFSKDKRKKSGFDCRCKKCNNARHKKYYDLGYYKKWSLTNYDYYQRYNKKYYEANKDKFAKFNKKYYEENKDKINQYYKKRFVTDTQYKLAKLLRNRLCKAIRNDQKTRSSVKDLGCSIPELKIYLEKQFKEDMSWKNYGKWHIDHKLPLKSFDLTDRNQLLKAVNYTNLQPLWAHDNIVKSDKI